MSVSRCLIATNRVRNIANELGQNPTIVANAIALWQEKNNRGIEEFPSDPKVLLDIIYKKETISTPLETEYNVNSYSGDITPSKDTIFVFGSNPEGRHGAGAAKVAKDKFGAQYGIGEGLTGNAYALPTKDLRVKENKGLRSISKESIIESIKTLYKVATENPGKQFKVAFRNKLDETTLNGYTGEEMIDMFIEAGQIPSNVLFSEEWVNTGKFNTSIEPSSMPSLKVESMSATIINDFIENGKDIRHYLFAKKDGISGISELTNWGNLSAIEYNDENYDTIKTEIDAIFDTAINSGKTIMMHDSIIDLIRDLKESAPRLSEYINSRRDALLEANKQRIEQEQTARQASLESASRSMEVQFEAPLKSLDSAKAHIQLYQQYSNREKRDRVTLITRLFSEALGKYYEATRTRLKEKINKEDDITKKAKLTYDLIHTTRASVLNEVGPETIFNEIKSSFDKTVKGDRNSLIEEEYQKFISNSAYNRFTDAQKRRAAERMVNRKINAFTKMLNNWEGLLGEAASLIKERERISIYFDEVIQDIEDTLAEELEETVKEGWMINSSTVSARESLSLKVKNLLANIVKMDINGRPDVDDLGYTRLLNPSYAYVSILTACRDMITSEDFIPALENMRKNHPWVSQVIDAIQKDPQMAAAMYHSMRRDFTDFWIQILDVREGKEVLRLKRVNKHTGYYYLIDSWRNNFNSGEILSNSSIYNKNGELSQSNATANLDRLLSLKQDYTKLGAKLFEDKKNLDLLLDLLKSTGIDTSSDIIQHTLLNIGSTKELTTVLNALSNIFTEVKKDKIKRDEEGIPDLINSMESAYTNIAEAIAVYDDLTVELSFRENGKSYYSMTSPNYLGKLMKRLKNSTNLSEDEYQTMLQNEYLKYQWFQSQRGGENIVLNHWLDLLKNNPSLRNKLEHMVLLNSEKVEYSEMDEIQYAVAMFNAYIQSDDSAGNFKLAWYATPTMSDSGSGEFIKFVKYEDRIDVLGNELSYKDDIMPHLVNLVKQELQRINIVKLRRRDSSIEKIANFDEKGDKFLFIPGLNNALTEQDVADLGIDTKFVGKSYIGLYRDSEVIRGDIDGFTRKVLTLVMNKEFDSFKEDWGKKGILDNPKIGVPKDQLNSKLEEFFWNHTLATSQIIQLTTTDLAYYGNYQEFIKRYKEVHAPGLKMYTQAMFNGERIGKDEETVIYLKDEEVSFKKEMISIIEKILKEKEKKGEISKFEINYILKKYKKINITDGQGFRTLDSFRAIMGMSGKWTQELEDSFKSIKNGTWNIEDFFIVLNTIKPYLYTQVSRDAGLGNGVQLKVPVQHKNSEAVLLAMYTTIAGVMGNSPKLKALNEFMVEKDIDAVQFKSAVKVGASGVIDITDVAISEKLKEKDNENKTVGKIVKEILQEQTGIEGTNFNFNTVHKFSFEDYVIQNPTPDHFMETTTLFGTQIRKLITADLPDNIEIQFNGKKYTKSEIIRIYNKLMTENIIESFVELDRKFSNPKEIEKLLQEQIKGNDRYDADLLNACTLDENGHFVIPLFDPVQSNRVQELINSIIKNRITKQKTRGASLIQMSNFGFADELQIEKDTEGTIVGYHVYMPATYASLFNMQIQPKGITRLDDFPVEVRKAIGYRIPTEDKYSMLPIIVDGFLPPQMGGMIMLPTGITTETGSDYDVDKLYLMLPSFEITEDGNIDMKETMDTREGRDNILLEIMYGILTSKAVSQDKVVPGGFDPLTRIFKITTILKNFDKLSSSELLEGKSKQAAIDYLFTLDLDKIKEIASPIDININPLNPSVHTTIFRDIMNGASSIGRYAVYNASHALLQHTTMQLVKPIKFMGREVQSLHNTHNKEGVKITNIISNYLAASVDNAKEGMLNGLGQNNLTISVTGFLANLGFTVDEITVFLNQPVLQDLYKKYSIKSSSGYVSIDEIVEEITNDYSIESDDIKFDYQDLKHMAYNIAFKDYWANHSNPEIKTKYRASQLFILSYFKSLYKKASQFDKRIKTFRADSSGGAAGPYVADNLDKEANLLECRIEDSLDDATFTGNYLLSPNLTIKELRKLADSDEGNPIVQAFYTLGIEGARNIFSKVTPYYGNVFKHLYEALRYLGVTDTITVNNTFNDFLTFSLSTLDIFNKKIDPSIAKEYIDKGIKITEYKNQRDLFIHAFPAYFKETLKKYPQLKELVPFLNNFGIRTIGKGIPTLNFRNVGSLTTELRDSYSKDWASLLYLNTQDEAMNNEARSLAINLFKYCYFRSGLSFSPKSFIHLVPTLVRINVPGYIEALQEILDYQDAFIENSKVVEFIDMYARHHPNSFKLWKYYKDSENIFYDENGDPKISLTIDESTPSSIERRRYINVDGKYLYINAGDAFVLTTPLGEGGQFQEYDIYGEKVNISGERALYIAKETAERVIQDFYHRGASLNNNPELSNISAQTSIADLNTPTIEDNVGDIRAMQEALLGNSEDTPTDFITMRKEVDRVFDEMVKEFITLLDPSISELGYSNDIDATGQKICK